MFKNKTITPFYLKPAVVTAIPDNLNDTEDLLAMLDLFKRLDTKCYFYINKNNPSHLEIKNKITNYNIKYIELNPIDCFYQYLSIQHQKEFCEWGVTEDSLWEYKKLEFLYKTLVEEKDCEYLCWLDYDLLFLLHKNNLFSDASSWPRPINSSTGKILEFSAKDGFYEKFSSKTPNLSLKEEMDCSIFCFDRETLKSMYLNIKSRQLSSIREAGIFMPFEDNFFSEICDIKYQNYLKISVNTLPTVRGEALFENYLL